MRTALVLLVGLFLVGVWLGHCDGESLIETDSSQVDAADDYPWVRTVTGWERATWHEPKSTYRPALHPLVVALVLGLNSGLGLLAFSRVESPLES